MVNNKSKNNMLLHFLNAVVSSTYNLTNITMLIKFKRLKVKN